MKANLPGSEPTGASTNKKMTKPQDLARLYDIMIQVCLLSRTFIKEKGGIIIALTSVSTLYKCCSLNPDSHGLWICIRNFDVKQDL